MREDVDEIGRVMMRTRTTQIALFAAAVAVSVSSRANAVQHADPLFDSFSRATAGAVPADAGEAVTQPVRTIGGETDSRTTPGKLLLSALLAAGCFQAARHRHDLKLADLPQWYHDAAPIQIRHTVRYELEPNKLEPCSFEAVTRFDLCSLCRPAMMADRLPPLLRIDPALSRRGPPHA